MGISAMEKSIINTQHAPQAVGPYSQAVRAGNTVYISGQIPLDPRSGLLIEGDIDAQARRVFANLQAVAEASGGGLNDIVKVNIYLTDLADFARVNAVMAEFFRAPFPARACVQVVALPKGAAVEAEATLVL